VTDLRRRSFLLGLGAAGVAGAAGGAATTGVAMAAADGSGDHQPRFVPFEGAHQQGITAQPVPALGLMAAFDVVSGDRDGLREMLRELTDEVRGLMAGRPPQQRSPAYPPVDSGILGDRPAADDLSVVVGVGASLFDDRFGLRDRRPRELVEMPFLANDRLDPARSHGDVLVTVEANHPDTVQFALRQVMRRTRGHLVLRWMVDGYARGSSGSGGSTQRNLMGFKDGTANLDTASRRAMARHVWVAPGDGEPAWAVGGSYVAVRLIRMLVEFWDRTRLSEQEAIIGRHKLSGAPLGHTDEHAQPDFAGDPHGRLTRLDSHIRLANPRTTATEESLILRRGFSYTRGFDAAGQLDQGLAFVSYQRSLERGFLAVQERLKGEPLEEYTVPEGGGFFFALPGVSGGSGFLGEGLLR
jgi:deferrochelatase/peroxidase EfeB